MNKSRIEAFSDGVIAIIITIMVLEIHVPDTANWEALGHLSPTLLGYLLSFVFVGIYWNQHHHLLHAAVRVTSGMMWANLGFLFCLSLIPFGTAWMSKTNSAPFAVVVYAVLLLLCGFTFDILRRAIAHSLNRESPMWHTLRQANRKSTISIICYLAAIPLAFVEPYISLGLFALVEVVWVIPSKAIEQHLAAEE